MIGKLSGVKVNGIEVGEGSVLLTSGGRLRGSAAPTEADEQAMLLTLLVGPAVKGAPRQPGGGMTVKHPELSLIYAINPNKGGNNSAAARGMSKAMGSLRGMPDLCLPVLRGPFLSLYLELKRRAKGRIDPEQAAIHDALRAQGHCVMTGRGVEAGAQIVLGYLALPTNRVSARPVPHDLMNLETIPQRIAEWRRQCYLMLAPQETR